MNDTEQQVEKMIADGKAIMDEAIEKFRPVAIVAAFSSGDDSMVSTHFAMDSGYGDYVFNADTMFGLAPSRQHLTDTCTRMKWELVIGQAIATGPPKNMRVRGKMIPFNERILPAGKWVDRDTAYEEFCMNFGFPGKGKMPHQRMYQRLKERPINQMLKSHGASGADSKPKVLIVSGVRGDESAIRAGYKRAYAKGGFGDVWVNPFYYHTAADFEAYRQEFGLPRNPVKRKCKISGECCCGTFGDSDERQAYAMVDQPFSDRLNQLEIEVKANGFPWGWGESPPASWVAQERIVKDAKFGQGFLFDADERIKIFQPMCVGCNNGRR